MQIQPATIYIYRPPRNGVMNLWLAKSVLQSHRASLAVQTTIMYSWHPMWVQSDQQVSLWLHLPGSSAKPPRQIEILVFRIRLPRGPTVRAQPEHSNRKWCQSRMRPKQLQTARQTQTFVTSTWIVYQIKAPLTNHGSQVLLAIMSFRWCLHTWRFDQHFERRWQRYCTLYWSFMRQTTNLRLTEWTKILLTTRLDKRHVDYSV